MSTYEHLSPRQREVLRLRCRGCSGRSIARRLFISEHSVKNHLTRAFAALGIGSLTSDHVATGRKSAFACYLLGMVDGLDVIDPDGRIRRRVLAEGAAVKAIRAEDV